MEQAIVNSILFSAIGIGVLIVAFFAIGIPNKNYHLWHQIVEKQNIALAILMGSFAVSVGLIVSAAVRG